MDMLAWAMFGFIAYTYAGYPLLVALLARCKPEPSIGIEHVTEWPSVTVIVPVHNEAQRVLGKIENLRALDYPSDRLTLLFVSDGSTDATVALLAAQPDVQHVVCETRVGKPGALNRALDAVRSEVVVFADVRQRIASDALRRLVARLLVPGVGIASGELTHVDPASQAAANIGLYWRYERWIRRAESRFASTVGTTGALYAMRRAHYTPLDENTVLDDFEQPMLVVRRGLRVVLESTARMFDDLQVDSAGERIRKVRTLGGNFQSFARHPWLFSPVANPLWWQFVSHKVFRLLVPYALAVLLVASWCAQGAVMRSLAVAQTAFYAMSAAGAAWPRVRTNRVVSFALVFVELNWAAVLGLREWCAGRVSARWKKT